MMSLLRRFFPASPARRPRRRPGVAPAEGLEDRILLFWDGFPYDYEVDILSRNAEGVWQVSSISEYRPVLTDQTFAVWNPNVDWADVKTGDFDGDGLGDIVGRDPGTGYWWVTLSDGVGTASDGVSSTTRLAGQWSAATTWSDVAVVDLAMPGDRAGAGYQGHFTNKDDLVGRASDGTWWAAIANGDGTFTNTPLAKWDASVQWRDVLFMDVDGNGETDILGRNSNGEWRAVLFSHLGLYFEDVKLAQWNEAAGWRDVIQVDDFFGNDLPGVLARTDDGTWWAMTFANGAAFTQKIGWWNPAGNWRDVMIRDFPGVGPQILGRTDAGQWWSSYWVGGESGLATYYSGSVLEAAGWRNFRYIHGTPVTPGSAGPFPTIQLIGQIATGEWYSLELSGLWPTKYHEAGYWSPAEGWRDIMFASNVTAPPIDIYRVEDLSTYLGRTTMVEIRGHRSGTVVTIENDGPPDGELQRVKITYLVPATGHSATATASLKTTSLLRFDGHLAADVFRNRSSRAATAAGWSGDDTLDGLDNGVRDSLFGGEGLDTLLGDAFDVRVQDG